MGLASGLPSPPGDLMKFDNHWFPGGAWGSDVRGQWEGISGDGQGLLGKAVFELSQNRVCTGERCSWRGQQGPHKQVGILP